ncbi:unnamed protein product [Mucor hiemalis]
MCGHNFCGTCLLGWFAQKKACPACRSPTIKQPIQNIALQNIIQILWPENRIPERKLQRSDWLELYPVQNQGNYIRDEDGEGLIYRCSNCAWELDEELFCGQCLIYYDDGEDRSNTRHNDEEITDTESHHEQDEDLEDFVVEDDHVDFENLDQDRILDDSSEIDSDIEISTIHINDDDSEEDEVRVRSRKRRRIRDEDDDSSVNSVISIEDDDRNRDTLNSRTSSRFIVDSDEELDEELDEEEDEEEEYPDDPFSRKRNVYIDDYADEDEEEESITPKQPKVDNVTQLISNAQAKMRAESSGSNMNSSSQIELHSDESSSSAGSDDEPDYNF